MSLSDYEIRRLRKIEEIDALAPSAYMNKDKSMLGTAGMAVAPDLVPATATADAEK